MEAKQTRITITDRIDWPSFAARHNMKWTKKPFFWESGAPLGNGFLGAMVYSAEDRTKRNALRFVMGRTDVSAKIPGAGGTASRIPLGEINLEMKGKIFGKTSMELDLYRAQLEGVMVTTEGEVAFRSFVHSTEPVLFLEIQPDEGEKDTKIKWYAYSQVTDVMKNEDGINFNQYIPPTTLTEKDADAVHVQIQRYSTTEGCTAAYCERCSEDGKRRFYLTLVNGGSDAAADEAVQIIKRAVSAPQEEWEQRHRDWWSAYFEKSFVSISDTRLEGFYLIQLYKLACAAREDSEIMDNQGPWMRETPWPRAWFNMNVQMAYSPVYTSNHLEIGESLCRNLDSHLDSLIQNVAEPYRSDSAGLGRNASYDMVSPVKDEVGNLTWLMHNYWRQYRYSMDKIRLRDHLFPLLKRSVQYYIHLLQEGEDHGLHLPAMISPEYGSSAVEDTTYDLSLLRWGCQTLLHICDILDISDPLQETWRRVLTDLTDYHQDEHGLMIGKDTPQEFGHRHFSHLLPIFPLHLMSGDTDEERTFIRSCLHRWVGFEGDMRGFTFAGAASIAASIGDGNEALRYVKTALHLFMPNTMYQEAGPVIESPLGVAEAMQDMLLQSWGREIRVFPAVPDEWPDVSFHNLRTEGAFLVSAVRRGGKTQWIRVESLAGEPCRIRCPLEHPICAVSEDGVSVSVEEDGTICPDLKKGQTIYLCSGKEPTAFIMEPVKAQEPMKNYFGEYKPWRLYGIPFFEA